MSALTVTRVTDSCALINFGAKVEVLAPGSPLTL